MRFTASYAGAVAAAILSLTPFTAGTPTSAAVHHVKRATTPISPKFFIISMFSPEAGVWYGIDEFDVLAQNITVPGLSPLFPDVHCTADGEICQMTTGESEINAASSVSGLVLSPDFNLTQTYFMVAGIAGVNPEVATTGAVTFAKYAVQVALQYEFDAREIPDNFTTGYVPFGAYLPSQYPQTIYGTEVFEVNEALQMMAINMASNVTLNDTATAQAYRARYAGSSNYSIAAQPPSVLACDVATSDVYYSGALLSEAFGNTTRLFTNGSGLYCTTAQEDNATLEALLRGALANLTDFSRIIVMRTASDFDRPPPGESAIDNLLYAEQGGFEIAINNIYIAGLPIVQGVLAGWNDTFSHGVNATNYIGDVFDSLGGTPDFGLPADFLTAAKRKRDIMNNYSRRTPGSVESNMRMKRKSAALMRDVVRK